MAQRAFLVAASRHMAGRRRRAALLAAPSLLALLLAAGLLSGAVALAAPSSAPHGSEPIASASAGGGTAAPPSASAQPTGVAVGLRVLRLVDGTRTIRLRDGRTEPRTLVTYLRYPALGAPGQNDLRDAPAASSVGPLPLVVFGHGFAVTPAIYARLLQSWARAGYAVAAPVFPLGNAHAPGGPDESDLINEPGDMSFVISSLLAASTSPLSPLAGLLDPTRIAVAGQSDGGEAALAVAYSRRLRDPRVKAAVILSGARMSGVGGYAFAGGAPLLAVQGTADTINAPRFTYAYFSAARRPKYLLRLLGAEHLPPYTGEQPQLGIVERTSVAFLDGYLKGSAAALGRLVSLGSVARASRLTADP
jgi:fermentation-respiration switch protein FrsA (DUF1100 family)